MSALTSIINFLYVYVRIFFTFIFGGRVYLSSFSGESYDIAKIIFDTLGLKKVYLSYGEPILILIVAIFTVGALIGLVHRLMK